VGAASPSRTLLSPYTLLRCSASNPLPGLENRTVTRVAVQQRNQGEPLDDLIVDGSALDDSAARLSLQVKRALTIGAGTAAARFANRDWRDIRQVLTIVDRFVRAVGDIPHVMGSFLTLCERSLANYPGEQFVDQIRVALSLQDGIPLGWRGTTMPARIAALVHAFAEKSTPLATSLAQAMLRILDRLVDMGDRRSAALQTSEVFKEVRF
jgi:hypothetical protein